MYRRMTCAMATDVMAPTVRKGQHIVADTEYYVHNAPRRWDVVLFWAPQLEKMGPELGKKRVDVRDGNALAIANAAVDILENPADPANPMVLRPHLFFMKRIVGLPGE